MSLTSLDAQGVWVLACSVTKDRFSDDVVCSAETSTDTLTYTWGHPSVSVMNKKCSTIKNLILCKFGELHSCCNEIICNKYA